MGCDCRKNHAGGFDVGIVEIFEAYQLLFANTPQHFDL
jgi:hypothetical protein